MMQKITSESKMSTLTDETNILETQMYKVQKIMQLKTGGEIPMFNKRIMRLGKTSIGIEIVLFNDRR